MGAVATLPLILLMLVASLAGNEAILDLDFTGGTAPPGFVAAQSTWTGDGLFLPGAVIARMPRAYPVESMDVPAVRAPYQAEVLLPDAAGRRLTVTMLVCLVAPQGDGDGLFSLGRRSRWLSAQVGRDGRLVVGLDNRWRLLPADGTARLDDRRWHAISVGLDALGQVRVAVDGQVADLPPAEDRAASPPLPLPDDQPLLAFADPGSARHLHGLVRRLLVHRGSLDRETLASLHRRLDPSGLPAPRAAVFTQALVAVPPRQPELPSTPAPVGASDF